MPQPLPWFNNLVDPLLPDGSTFPVKPALYYYDEYQTYDLIEVDAISVDLIRLFEKIPFWVQFYDFKIKHLFDRYTPFNHIWCGNYSTKLFNFLKKYSGTIFYKTPFLGARQFLNNINWGIDNNNSFLLGNFTTGQGRQQITFTLPSNIDDDPITFTWLRINNDKGQLNNGNNLSYDKDYQIVNPKDSKTVTLVLKGLLSCSLIVTSNNTNTINIVEQLINNISSVYLYDNFDTLLSNLDNYINTVYPKIFKVLKSVPWTEAGYYLNGFRALSYGSSRYFYCTTGVEFSVEQLQYNLAQGIQNTEPLTDANLTDIPSWYKFYGITYANNNYWNNAPYNNIDNSTGYYFLESSLLAGGYIYKGNFETGSLYVAPTLFPPIDIVNNLPLLFGSPNGNFKLNTIRDDIIPYEIYPSDYQSFAQTVVEPLFPNPVATNVSHTKYIREITIAKKEIFSTEVYNSYGALLLQYPLPAIYEFASAGSYNNGITNVGNYAELADIAITPNADNTGFDTNIIFYKQGGMPDTASKFNLSNEPPIELFVGYRTALRTFRLMPTIPQNEIIQKIDDYHHYLRSATTPYGEFDKDMPDSVRIKDLKAKLDEIHTALDAGKYSKDDNNPNLPRVANLGFLTHKVSQTLGCDFNSDGTARSIRQKHHIDQGQPIPAGWSFGQFGVNSGYQYQKGTTANQNDNAPRLGIVYEVRSNRLVPDPFNPKKSKIVEGGFTLCENLFQLLDELLDDLDKALGWQELGAIAIPNADGSGRYSTFEGMYSILAELAYMNSQISRTSSQGYISSLVTQAVVKEILTGLGLPIVPKSFPVDVGGKQPGRGVYPGLAMDSPTLIKVLSWVLENLSVVVAQATK